MAALVGAFDGTVVALYEYDPFHRLLRVTGPLGLVNPFLAATKFFDWETSLYYYGFRYFNPQTGRWLSADPASEKGGINLFTFVRNEPIRRADLLGLMCLLRRNCDTACDEMKRKYTNMGTTAATVICCEGKKKICVYVPGGGVATGSKSIKIVSNCLIKHELDHWDHLDCPSGVPLGWPIFQPGWDKQNTECAGYWEELNCLKSTISECGGDKLCAAEISDRIDFVNQQLLKYCPEKGATQ
jgi:RHS repeat-associated protein